MGLVHFGRNDRNRNSGRFQKIERAFMNDQPDNLPAFPLHMGCTIGGKAAGMTLRDYLAAKAMQGMAASAYWSENFTSSDSAMRNAVAQVAYQMADAMILARKKVATQA